MESEHNARLRPAGYVAAAFASSEGWWRRRESNLKSYLKSLGKFTE
jgi:hypothetical protein